MQSFIVVLASLLPAAEPSPEAQGAAGAIAKGLAYLEKEGARWKEERKCASCHHLPLGIWTLHEARQAGYTVSDALLEEWTTWVLTDSQARVLPDPEKKNPEYSGVEMGAVYTSLALAAMPAWDDRARAAWNKIAAHLLEKEAADGSFPSGEGRPPIFERPEATTALAVLALSHPEREASGLRGVAAERARALAWLAQTPTGGSHQALVLRLLVLARPGGPPDAARGLLADLLKRQNPDGGWSQTPEMPADALATGQSLYALRTAGLPAGDPAIRRGVAFLVQSQSPDGNWPMTSRPVMDKPDGGPAKYLVPITYAGSAWATLGLVRGVSRPRSVSRDY